MDIRNIIKNILPLSVILCVCIMNILNKNSNVLTISDIYFIIPNVTSRYTTVSTGDSAIAILFNTYSFDEYTFTMAKTELFYPKNVGA